MKFSEIIQELRIGKVGPSVSTIDRSAPWTKRGIEIAADRTRTFRSLETSREQIDFLYKESNGFTSTSIRPVFVVGNDRYPFKSYNPSTGIITLKDAGHTRQKTIGLYKISADEFKFDKRLKSPSQSGNSYIFRADDVGERSTEDNPDFKVANPAGRGPAKGKLGKASDEFNRRANNPFGM